MKRISHATFETPDLERLTAYYTNVIGLVPLEREKDRVLFVSRLGDNVLRETDREPVSICAAIAQASNAAHSTRCATW